MRIDAMRGAAMTCVVLGHAVQRNLGTDEPLFLLLAAFEMPLFAFVSGYLTRPPSQHRSAWIATRAQRLLVPFVAWSPILWFMSRFHFTGLDVVGMPQSLATYLCLLFPRPSDGLWYLLVLFYWYLIALLASQLLRHNRWILSVAGGCVAVLLAVVARRIGVFGMLPGDFGSRYLATLLPYFAAGLTLFHFRYNTRCCASASGCGGSLVAFAVVATSVLLTSVSSSAVSYPAVLDLAEGALGVTASVLFIRSIREEWLGPLAVVGKSSLGVYAMHLLFLRSGFGDGWTKALTSFVLALLLSLLGT